MKNMKETDLVDLKVRAAELEQTLHLQLAQLRKDSGVWLKVGGAVLAAGVIATVLIKKRKGKKDRLSYAADEVTYTPIQSKNKKRHKKSKSSSFFAPIRKRLLLALFSFGQAQVMAQLKKRKSLFDEA